MAHEPPPKFLGACVECKREFASDTDSKPCPYCGSDEVAFSDLEDDPDEPEDDADDRSFMRG